MQNRPSRSLSPQQLREIKKARDKNEKGAKDEVRKRRRRRSLVEDSEGHEKDAGKENKMGKTKSSGALTRSPSQKSLGSEPTSPKPEADDDDNKALIREKLHPGSGPLDEVAVKEA